MSRGVRVRPVAATVIGMLVAAPFALGQEPSGPPPKDTIFARKILMGAIDMNMDAVETMRLPRSWRSRPATPSAWTSSEA